MSDAPPLDIDALAEEVAIKHVGAPMKDVRAAVKEACRKLWQASWKQAAEDRYVAVQDTEKQMRELLTTPIDRLVDEVWRLHDIDARHKRGFRLSQRTGMDALLHTIEELTEVGRAKTQQQVVSEFGDALACFIHAIIKHGHSVHEVAAAALAKLPKDFPEEA